MTAPLPSSSAPNLPVDLFRDSNFTYQSYGTVTAPSANDPIASTVIGVAGLYEITAYCCYGATGDVAGNMQIFSAAGGVRLPVQGGNNTAPSVYTILLKLAANSSVGVYSVNAGAAGSIYNAMIVARLVG